MHSALGLATHFVPASKWETLHARLREPNADQHLDGMLAELHQKEPPKEPAIPWELINKHFGKESLAAVIDSLAADSSPLAQSTLESLRKLSPTALHVWFPHRPQPLCSWLLFSLVTKRTPLECTGRVFTVAAWQQAVAQGVLRHGVPNVAVIHGAFSMTFSMLFSLILIVASHVMRVR